MRLLDPTAGSIKFDGAEIATLKGEPLRKLRQRFQMIFQDPYSSLNPRMTVGSIVEEPLDIHSIGTPTRADGASDRELLELVGLGGKAANRFPHEFSGGQRQRDRDRARAGAEPATSSWPTSRSVPSTCRSGRRS